MLKKTEDNYKTFEKWIKTIKLELEEQSDFTSINIVDLKHEDHQISDYFKNLFKKVIVPFCSSSSSKYTPIICSEITRYINRWKKICKNEKLSYKIKKVNNHSLRGCCFSRIVFIILDVSNDFLILFKNTILPNLCAIDDCRVQIIFL